MPKHFFFITSVISVCYLLMIASVGMASSKEDRRSQMAATALIGVVLYCLGFILWVLP